MISNEEAQDIKQQEIDELLSDTSIVENSGEGSTDDTANQIGVKTSNDSTQNTDSKEVSSNPNVSDCY